MHPADDQSNQVRLQSNLTLARASQTSVRGQPPQGRYLVPVKSKGAGATQHCAVITQEHYECVALNELEYTLYLLTANPNCQPTIIAGDRKGL